MGGWVLRRGVCYVEMAITAAREVLGPGPLELARIEFAQVLALPEGTRSILQFVLSPASNKWFSFRVYSRSALQNYPDEGWTLHARGQVRLADAAPLHAPQPPSAAQICARCPTTLFGAEHYKGLEARGFHYGPSLRALDQLWLSDREAAGRLSIPAALRSETARYRVHPALIEVAGEVLLLALPQDGATYVPVRIRKVV